MKILVCCAGGMSSSMLVHKLREEIKNQGLTDILVGSCGKNQLYQYLEEADYLLLAPQIDFLSEQINDLSSKYAIKILKITMEEYGNMDVKSILDRIIGVKMDTNQKDNISRYNKFLLVLNKIALSKPLSAISSAFTSIIPITILGSIFLLLKNLPINIYMEWIMKNGLYDLLTLGVNTTIDLISIYVVFFIAYHYIQSIKLHGSRAGLVALICFFILSGQNNKSYSLEFLGVNGLFGAIFVGITVAILYKRILVIYKKFNFLNFIPQQVKASLESVLPSLIIITLFVILEMCMRYTQYGNFHSWIYGRIQYRLINLIGNNIISYVIIQLMINLLWFFGIHGGNTMTAITAPVYTTLALQNFSQYSSGLEPQHIISSSFGKCFISGGVGSMLSLAILMMFFSKSKRLKTIGKISFPMTLFFINEPILFGLPIVLNPYFFIPLVFITPVLAILTYLMMWLKIVPIPIGVSLPWTTPPILYGFLQGSWKIALWEIICIILSGIMWFPFFKIADKKACEEENNSCHN